MGHMSSNAERFGVTVGVISVFTFIAALVWILATGWAWDAPHIVLTVGGGVFVSMLVGAMANE